MDGRFSYLEWRLTDAVSLIINKTEMSHDDYLRLAADPVGNKELLSAMVQKAAVSAGFIERKMFRGHAREVAPSDEPFRCGAAPSFTDIPEVALVYAHKPESWGGFDMGRSRKTPYTQVREAYIKIDKPLVLKNLMASFGEVLTMLRVEPGSKEARSLFEDVVGRNGKPAILVKHPGWDSYFAHNQGHGRAAGDYRIDSYAYPDSRVFVEMAKKAGWDGVVHKDTFKNGLRHLPSITGATSISGLSKNATHTTWRPLYSENIKLADVVTYDGNGNVIPLENRFYGKDIRGESVSNEREGETVELAGRAVKQGGVALATSYLH